MTLEFPYVIAQILLQRIIRLSVVTSVLTYITSFAMSKFPNTREKKDGKLACNNYRPISLLLMLSKIFEKSIHQRVTSFLEIKQKFL